MLCAYVGSSGGAAAAIAMRMGAAGFCSDTGKLLKLSPVQSRLFLPQRIPEPSQGPLQFMNVCRTLECD